MPLLSDGVLNVVLSAHCPPRVKDVAEPERENSLPAWLPLSPAPSCRRAAPCLPARSAVLSHPAPARGPRTGGSRLCVTGRTEVCPASPGTGEGRPLGLVYGRLWGWVLGTKAFPYPPLPLLTGAGLTLMLGLGGVGVRVSKHAEGGTATPPLSPISGHTWPLARKLLSVSLRSGPKAPGLGLTSRSPEEKGVWGAWC